jgi:ribosomal peptide maturation radical SAM protein 1
MNPSVALVYPPFGPKTVPPLGLALLSAGVKQLGFECRVFYWNLELIGELGGSDLQRSLFTYERLSRNGFFPYNEWIFAKQVFPENDDERSDSQPNLSGLDKTFGHGLKQRVWSKLTGTRRLLEQRPSDLVLRLRERAPGLVDGLVNRLAGFDIIGINSTFYQNLAALALAKKLKLRWPNKTVVLGGANCDGELGQSLIEHFPFLDFVFAGEVDFSFPEFVRRLSQNLPIDQIPGILFRDGSGSIASGPRAMPIQEMDRLPLPDFDDYVATRERLGLTANRQLILAVESSRGCWWGAKQHCTFCGLNAMGMSYREKSQDRFKGEVEHLAKRYGTRYLAVTDNILSMSYFKQFMRWSKQRELSMNLFWEIKANLDRQQVKSLAEAGINWVQPGIESFSSDVLTLMRKGVRGIQNIAFLKYARENGVVTSYFILYGFPGEAPGEYEKMRSTVRKLVHLEPPRGVCEIEYDRFSPYHQDPASFGLRLKPKSGYQILYPFSDEIIARLVYFFERDDAPRFPYVKRLKQEVRRWQRLWQRNHRLPPEEGASLTWTEQNGDVVIEDRRPGFPRRRYRLKDYAVEVFHALDRPTTLQAVVRASKKPQAPSLDLEATPLETPRASTKLSSENRPHGWWKRLMAPVPGGKGSRSTTEQVTAFARGEFESRPAKLLKPLVTAGIVYVDDGWYLALPVARESKPSVRWEIVSTAE